MVRPWNRELLDEVASHLAEKHPGTVWLLEQPEVHDLAAAAPAASAATVSLPQTVIPIGDADGELVPVG